MGKRIGRHVVLEWGVMQKHCMHSSCGKAPPWRHPLQGRAAPSKVHTWERQLAIGLRTPQLLGCPPCSTASWKARHTNKNTRHAHPAQAEPAALGALRLAQLLRGVRHLVAGAAHLRELG